SGDSCGLSSPIHNERLEIKAARGGPEGAPRLNLFDATRAEKLHGHVGYESSRRRAGGQNHAARWPGKPAIQFCGAAWRAPWIAGLYPRTGLMRIARDFTCSISTSSRRRVEIIWQSAPQWVPACIITSD